MNSHVSSLEVIQRNHPKRKDGENYDKDYWARNKFWWFSKKKLEFICDFCNTTPKFINGSIRKIDKTNLSYIEPHRIIINDITFLAFNYSTEIYIKNLSKKIQMLNCKTKFHFEEINSTESGKNTTM